MTLDNRKRNKAAICSSKVEHQQQPAGSDSEVEQEAINTEAAHRAKIMNGLKDLTDRENKSFRYAP